MKEQGGGALMESLALLAALALLAGVIVVPIMIGGNFRTEIAIPGPAPAPGATASFHEDLSASHWLLGLVKGEQADVDEVVARHLRTGNVLTSLTIVTRHSPLNNLVGVVTLGIYMPVTVTVRGETVSPASVLR